jgi:death-on-curing protein
VEYLTYEKLVAMHVLAMRDHWAETYFGVSSPGLLKSALARPKNASHYEQADGLRQAAYLFQGLLMNHGFLQGNKRTAWLSLRWFLMKNHIARVLASKQAIIDMCYAAENQKWSVDQIDQWLRANTVSLASEGGSNPEE